MVDSTLKDMGVKGKSIPVKRGAELSNVDALILPGGESTTISKLMTRFDMYDSIRKAARDDDLPILGTCAGCILLANRGDSEVTRTKTKLLGLMDMEVSRNSWGRQVDSFEAEVLFDDFDYHAVFIRAPAINKVAGKCKVLAKFEGEIIGAREGRRMAITFHPELTDDTRIHRYFLEAARE